MAADPKKHTAQISSKKPEEYLTLIKSADRKVADLAACEVSLRSEKVSWVTDFVAAGGLAVLLDILGDICNREEILTNNDNEILPKTLLCMKGQRKIRQFPPKILTTGCSI